MASKKIDKFFEKIFDKAPEFIWSVMSKRALLFWERTTFCVVCHYWRARLHGWLDAICLILLLWGIYELNC